MSKISKRFKRADASLYHKSMELIRNIGKAVSVVKTGKNVAIKFFDDEESTSAKKRTKKSSQVAAI